MVGSRRRGTAAALYKVYASLLLGALAVAMALAQKIPEVHAPTLAGNAVNLPSDLHGKIGVLVLGFSKKSAAQCRGWFDPINRDFGGDARSVNYQMPVLQDVPGFVRGMLIRGMRNDLPVATRGRFIPLVQDEAAWKAVAQYGPEDDAYVLLVDETGQVKWRTHGAATAAAYAVFKTTLAAMEK